MVEVTTNDAGGLDEPEVRDMLQNLQLYQSALDRCNLTIQLYNGGK